MIVTSFDGKSMMTAPPGSKLMPITIQQGGTQTTMSHGGQINIMPQHLQKMSDKPHMMMHQMMHAPAPQMLPPNSMLPPPQVQMPPQQLMMAAPTISPSVPSAIVPPPMPAVPAPAAQKEEPSAPADKETSASDQPMEVVEEKSKF
jgi:hypothetical protein